MQIVHVNSNVILIQEIVVDTNKKTERLKWLDKLTEFDWPIRHVVKIKKQSF